jgi:hypothetical protein
MEKYWYMGQVEFFHKHLGVGLQQTKFLILLCSFSFMLHSFICETFTGNIVF